MSLSFGGGSGLKYLGVWDADQNDPQLITGTGKNGTYYIVSVASGSHTITAFANYGATVTGTVKATSTGHGRTTGDQVVIAGSTNFNGTVIITVIDNDSFYFTDTWVSTPGETGTWEISVDGYTNWALGEWILFSKQAGGWQKGPGFIMPGNSGELIQNSGGIAGACTSLSWDNTNKNLSLPNGGSATAAADSLKIYAADYATADTRLYVKSESGNPIILGKNEVQFYNTVDLITDYERAYARWDTNVFTIGTEKGAGGSNRDLAINSAGNTLFKQFTGFEASAFILSGQALFVVDNGDVRIDNGGWLTIQSEGSNVIKIAPEVGMSGGICPKVRFAHVLFDYETEITKFPNSIDSEYAYLKWDTNVFKFGTEIEGTSTPRKTQLQADTLYSYNALPYGTAYAISKFEDYSGTVAGTVKVTCATHNLPASPTPTTIIIHGTTNYNGTFADAIKIDATSFYYTDAYVANDATGTMHSSYDYERLALYWTGNVATILSAASGSGTVRNIAINAGTGALVLTAASATLNSYTLGPIDDTKGNGDAAFTWSADKIFDQLALKSNIASPTFTGIVTAAEIQATGDITGKVKVLTATAADDDWYVTIVDMKATAYTLANSTPGDGLAHTVTVTHADQGGSSPTDTLGNLAIVGTDADGAVQSEDLAISANATATSTKYYASITSPITATWAIDVGDGPAADHIKIGFGPGIKPSSIQMLGSMIRVQEAATVKLPAVVTGNVITLYATTAAVLTVDPDDVDRLILDGAVLAAGTAIASDGTAGAAVTMVGDSADGFTNIGKSKTWA